QQAVEDWSGDSNTDLALFDLRLNPVISEPSSVVLTYRWTSPEQCVLAWKPAPTATAYRIEESPSPDFAEATLLAELSDGRQVQYSFSPPSSRVHYYRVIPLNQGVPGPPSDPVSVTPIVLNPPILEPVEWAEDGGYVLAWTPIPQATSYEVQTSDTPSFEPEDSPIIYRGEHSEARLPQSTDPGQFYRVRALNVLYAPGAPSPWSNLRRAPGQLGAPTFTRVTPQRLNWTAVPGALHYEVLVTPKGQDEGQGETVLIADTGCATADQPATYRVRALRRPDDQRTASEWSEPVMLQPAGGTPSRRQPILPFAMPVLIGLAAVAALVGLGLGLVAFQALEARSAEATRTPLPRSAIDATLTAESIHAGNATSIVQLGDANLAFQATIQAQVDAEETRIHIPTLTPSITPNATRTVAAALRSALTATAGAWTATPSPTLTPTLTPTITPSITPSPTETPDLTETVEAALASALTGTASAWTATPSPTRTPTLTLTVTPSITPSPTPTITPSITPSPTNTPDLTGTVGVAVNAALAATQAALPTATRTPPPSSTPNWVATADAALIASLPAGCYLIVLPNAPLPVYAGPSTSYRVIADAVPRLAEVIGRWYLPFESSDWRRVEYVAAGQPVQGWIPMPEGAPAGMIGGPGCLPDVHIVRLDPVNAAQLAAFDLCVVRPTGGQRTTIRSGPSESEPVLAVLGMPLIVLERRAVSDGSTTVWLRVWLDDQERTGWINERLALMRPADCTERMPVSD
ncbi:MAG: hypothetical protein JW910_08530, partial [Anaerolineae bacterium]|nr:hypothetical protein [Anaerolineae bacterium]